MREHRTAFSAVLLTVATIGAAGYVFRRTLLEWAVGLAGARLLYGWVRAQLGIRPARRRGPSWWELGSVAAGAVAGWVAGKERP